MVDGRGEIYSARQSLGMQEKDRQDCFHIIVPSSSSQRYAFVCRVFFCAHVCLCVYLCVLVRDKERVQVQRRG